MSADEGYGQRRDGRLTGGSLAASLPADAAVPAHSQTGAVVIRPAVRTFDGGEVTTRFKAKARELAKRRAAVYRQLAD